MKIKNALCILLSLAFILGLSACGGGGGGGGTASVNLQSAPGLAAMAAYVQASHFITLTAQDGGGNNYMMQLTASPNSGTSVFEGVSAFSSSQTVSISKNASLVSNSATTSFYTLTPFAPLGGYISSGTPYLVATSFGGIPTTINVGDSGNYAAETIYHDASKAVVDGIETVTYSVQEYNAASVLYCQNIVVSNITAQGTIDGIAASTQQVCYTVNASGSATLISWSIVGGGGTLNFRV